jgi:hypothetical protein
MTHSGVSHIDRPALPAPTGMGAAVAVFFLAWLALILVLGSRGAFVAAPGAPPLGLMLGLFVPLALFGAGYRTVPSIREFVLSADPRLIVGMQAWRWAGFEFIALYSYKVLPGLFAWASGVGDMAIGVTAPFVLAALLRDPDFVASKRFVAWNLSGILDFTIAVTLGAVVPLVAPKLYGSVTTDPMLHLPLVLIPTFLVPMFLMLHITALLQARRLRATMTRR